MKNKGTLITILSIATFIICMVLNFPEFKMGSFVTIKNVIVTFSYVAIWILVLIVGVIGKKSGIVLYSSVFWIITLFISILTVYINVTGNSANWALPFAILFLGQWYGLGFFVWSILSQYIVIALISLSMLTITVITLKHYKSA